MVVPSGLHSAPVKNGGSISSSGQESKSGLFNAVSVKATHLGASILTSLFVSMGPDGAPREEGRY